MEIELIKEAFTVCKVKDFREVDPTDTYCFVGKTDEECSLVCATDKIPANTVMREDGWRAFRLKGIYDFSLTGILAKIADILAHNEISIFAISTYNTDYVLVKENQFGKALAVLKESGYSITEWGGEHDRG